MSMLPPSLFFLPLRSGVPSLIIIMGCMFLFKALEKGEKAGSSEDEDEDETKKKQKEEEGTEGEEEYEEEELEEVTCMQMYHITQG